jgi:uncharacterized protein (DUF362 family)/ferredoxin
MMKSKVFIQEADYSTVAKAIDRIFQDFPLEIKNKLVWVKPNILADSSPEMAVTTHPAVVKAVVNYLRKGGARVVVGDNGGARAYGANERAARRTGIMEASQNCYKNIGQEVKTVLLPWPQKEEITISKIAQDCDLMISLPKLKTHLVTMFTAGIKNSFGMLAGTSKMDMHRKYPAFNDFSAVVAGIYNLRKPDLLILDAVVCMEGDGPNCPSLRTCNRILASNDAVSMDAVAARMIGADLKYVPMVTSAVKMNFGTADFSNMEIIGEITSIPRFVLPRTYGIKNPTTSFINLIIHHIITTERLRVSGKKCISCQRCFENCPVQAIEMRDHAFIHQEKCILCYCCKEICPVHAVEFTGAYGILQKICQKFFTR